jgi:exosortase A-associated hydrolase 1/exosortase A-associated hydrolase 2
VSHPPTGLILGPSEGFAGARYALLHSPPAGVSGLGAMVYLPPLGEEMNRSRRMAAVMCRRLAQSGWTVLQLDLFACGDSAGELEHATWEGWEHDALAAHQWLKDASGFHPWLWGLRHGALIAAAVAPRIADPVKLLLWQPVIDGATALRQLLRPSSENRATTAERMAELAAGQTVHVAGQVLTPSVARGLQAARLDLSCARAQTAVWLDVTPDGLPLHGRIAAMRPADSGEQTHWVHNTICGPSFWVSADIEEAPALVDSTLKALAETEPAARSESLTAPEALLQAPAAAQVGQHFEVPIGIAAGVEVLQGIVADAPLAASLGLIIVVGGPQVRTGAHRLFTQLARHAADAGFPSLRFDLRGMGDSTGTATPFDNNSPELSAAIDALIERCPSVQRVALLGLCDGASSALLYSEQQDARVAGLLLLNPWAHSANLAAQTRLRHHYPRRFLERDFWQKLARGRINWQGLRSMWRDWRAARQEQAQPEFLRRMEDCWFSFPGSVRVFLSQHDYTAREFERAHADWISDSRRPDAPRSFVNLVDADHTLSDPAARQRVAGEVEGFLRSLAKNASGEVRHG